MSKDESYDTTGEKLEYYTDSENSSSLDYSQNQLPYSTPQIVPPYKEIGVNCHKYRATLTTEGTDMEELLTQECDTQLELGAVYKDVSSFFVNKAGNSVHVHELNYSRVVVLSQSCDIEWNKKSRVSKNGKHDKILLTVLVAPLFDSVKATEGKHLNGFSMNMQAITRRVKDRARKYDIARHHILNTNMFNNKGINIGFDEGIIDFKHFFTIPVNSLTEDKYVDSIKLFHREKLSQRFSSFLSRIGIPEEPENEPTNPR